MPPQVMSPEVLLRRNQETIDEILDRLVHRVDRTLDQCRRFEELAAVMTDWARRWPTAALARWLHVVELDRTTVEMALVALALQASAQAGAVIDEYDPTGHGEAHRLFYEVVRIEWEQRYQGARMKRRAS